MPPVMFSVVTKYHKGRHSLFLYNSEIFYAFTQDILRSPTFVVSIYKVVFMTLRDVDKGRQNVEVIGNVHANPELLEEDK
ncbi:hypothetical protein EQJ86_13350 [Lactiplantibacillus plantarum]|nr:hypothetical protein EQJ86_13350 [Lactiplantibacillus plantarum]